MDGFRIHSEAIQLICHIFLEKKKLKGDLRPLNSDINKHLNQYYGISPDEEIAFGFYPQRILRDVHHLFQKVV